MTRTHFQLDSGVELAVLHLPERRAVAMDIRMLAGLVDEPADKLGLAHLVGQTLDKGTQGYDGRGLSDAFDEIGASWNSWCGREMCGFTSLCLPEFFERNVELHAEFLRRPTYPEDSCAVAIELARQELLTLEDDPQSLADKLIGRQAFGPLLGRHAAGERQTLDAIGRADFVRFWEGNYRAGRMLVSVAGPLKAEAVEATVDRYFSGFGPPEQAPRRAIPVEFGAVSTHHPKKTEQEQIAIALPGVAIGHEEHAAERILVNVLSGGMSARLFTEVREKQGLVYWVGAWTENPRKSGMVLVGASAMIEHCEQVYATLLRELERVGQDVTTEEVERALTGIAVRADIRAAITRAQCSEQADDLFHYGRPVPWEEKLSRLQAVTADDVMGYCARYLANGGMSAVSLGPHPLAADGVRESPGPVDSQ